MRKIAEFFTPCPKCKLVYLIIYDNGDTECTNCGHQSSGETPT